MNKRNIKIKALKYARDKIDNKDFVYICHALDYYRTKNFETRNVSSAIDELKQYIGKALGAKQNDSGRYPNYLSLHNWLHDKKNISYSEMMVQEDMLKQTRLNWIDWMINCLEGLENE